MSASLDSKTMIGLFTLLLVTTGLVLVGKLTPEAVDVIKWIGGSFMSVRVAANVMENLPRKGKDE